MDLAKSHIVITGAGGAFGSYLASSFAEVCEHVTGIDLKQGSLSDDFLARENVSFIEADLTDDAAVKSAVEAMTADGRQIHGLINNAGVIHSEPLVNLFSRESPLHSLESWKKVIDINLTAVFTLSAHVAHAMMKKRTKGCIVNISSISAYGNAGQSAYSASKAGVIGLTKTWAKEMGMWGIRNNAVSPGFFDTDSTHHALTESVVKHVKSNVPLRRLGKPDELFHALKFVLENDYLNGEVIDLNGGLTL